MTDTPKPRSARLRALLRLWLPSLAMLAGPVQAREVMLTITTADNYRGIGAYLIVYITDADRGDYQGTLYAAGHSTRYYGQFRHWWRATEPVSKHREREFDGKTGASIERNGTITVPVQIADDLFDRGLVLRVDTSVQEGRDIPSDAVLPLETLQAGQPVEGRHYVARFSFGM